ncbi:MAG TPA: hypothetical protein VFJ90_13445, partial [Candidatus Didemnitutus sp.]|nr:hypothetical protein [Candidatus Didemnitutus sp.]
MITPTSLGKQIAAKQAEDEGKHGPASFHHVIGTDRPAYIEFRPNAVTRAGLPYVHLCHYTLEPNQDPELSTGPERLTIGFSSADVMIYGARLGQILEKLVAQRLDWVAIVDERYAGLSERAWVGRIDFHPYGKQTPPPAPSSDTTEDRGPIRTSLRDRDQGNTEP